MAPSLENAMIGSADGSNRKGMESQEWPPVWFTLVQHEWNSLAIVPAHADMSVLPMARALVAAGRLYDDPGIALVEAEELAPGAAREVVAFLRDRAASGLRTVVALSSPLTDHGATPIARACEASVLVVPLGKTERHDARQTIERIGPAHFLGAITAAATQV